MFINYGLTADIEYVINNISVDFTGKILICKLGKIFWGKLVSTMHNACGSK